MATIYICKCGRQVRKSTNADNTGNRDTAGCRGCPYLLPWGPTQWDATRHAMVTDVKGYECRMSPEISYATDYSGSADDKRTMAIHSLDFDFLEEVQAWIDEYADGQLSGRFSRDTIRGTDYYNKGRYSWSISCAQNKKGMAAKGALIERFFGPDGHRLDKTPEEEKAIVLAAIEAGKAKAQERKESMEYTISKHVATGRLYAYYKGSLWFWDEYVQKWLLSQFAEDLYQEYRKNIGDFTREDMLAQAVDFYLLDDYEVSPNCIENLLQCNPKTAIPAPASAESPEIVDECSEPNCTCSDCKRQDCTCAGGCDAGDRGKCDGEKNCAQDGCTYTAKHQENPTHAAPASPVDAGAATQSLSDAGTVSLAADFPDVCQSCQCATCGNEGCASPCWENPREVRDCEITGPAGDACRDYRPKEDVQCQKENAPSADAAATSDESAARMCEGPDEETRTTPAAASGAALESLPAQSALPQNAPAQDIAADAPSAQGFDFSALGDMAEQAAEADAQFDLHYGLAQEEYVVSCIYLARIHALTAKAGRYGGGTWTAWYQSKGISDGTKNRMLEIGYGFKSATVADLKNLPELTKKELNLIARNGVANQVVEAAGEGDSDRIQDILNQLKAVQTERDEARKAKEKAEQERDAARDAQANLSAMANKFSKQRDAAEQRVEDAERRARAAEEDAAGWKQAGLEMQELVDQRDERIRELESGITVEAAAVDREEIERRANELSEPLVKIINQQDEQIERMASGNTVAAQASVLEQYLGTMKASLLGNASRVELACYDVRALDSLAEALREFADSIDGIFEDRSEDND